MGSSDETKGRSKLSWEEGCAYLVPSNGGRSVGWVHTAANQLDDTGGDNNNNNNNNDNNSTDIGPTPAVVYTIKIPKKDETNHNDQSDYDKDGGWTHQLTQLCQDTLLHQKKDEDCVYIAMSEEASRTVRQVLMELNKPS